MSIRVNLIVKALDEEGRESKQTTATGGRRSMKIGERDVVGL